MINCFSQLGNNIVLDVNSGSVHVFDDTAFLLAKYFEKNGFVKEINGEIVKQAGITDISAGKEAFEEILKLHENGLFFAEDLEEAKKHKRETVIKAVCIHIAHDCNLRCKYCFADTGFFFGEREMMSKETGEKTIDFVIKNSGNRKNIEVDFFGGEPLMNFETVKHIVSYAKEKEKAANKNFRFTITTNGLLLDDEKIKYINENMQNVVLSLDGTKEVNDYMRIRPGGSGSYDKIVSKFLKVAESRNQDNYYVRGTFTRYNLNFAKDVLHLADLGFKQTSVEPVVLPENSEFALRKEDLPAVFAEYDKLATEYVKRKKEGKGFNFFHFLVDLEQGPCIFKRTAGCGSGCEYVAVTPKGDIYPCHQFVGSDFIMGNVNNDGGINGEIKNRFEESSVYTKEACKKCFAKFFCSGGCHANNYNFNGTLDIPYDIGCQLERKRVECAIGIKVFLEDYS